jgi:putative ABC transport system permease protein
MAALGRLVRELDPQLPPPAMRRLTDLQSVVLLPARAAAAALGGIGAIAFLLAAVGVGGVAAYAVAQRRREIGVRVALGAPPATMLRAVLGETWRTVAIGSVAGLVLAGAVSRVLHSQLFGVSTLDPVTFATVPALLVALGVGAAWVPARRALAVSAIEALRSE